MSGGAIGEDLGAATGGTGKYEDGTEFTESTSPGERSCSEHSSTRLGEDDTGECLSAIAAEGEGHGFIAGADLIKGAAQGADRKGGGDGKLGEHDPDGLKGHGETEDVRAE